MVAAQPSNGHPHLRTFQLVSDILGVEVQHIGHVFFYLLGIGPHGCKEAQGRVTRTRDTVLYLNIDAGLLKDRLESGGQQLALASTRISVHQNAGCLLTCRGHDVDQSPNNPAIRKT